MPRVLAPLVLALSVAAFGPSPAGAEEVENPVYTSWTRCRPGTTLVVREVAESEAGGGERVVTTKRRVLRSVDDRKLVVEESTEVESSAGTSQFGPQEYTHRRTMFLPEGVDKARLGRPQKADAQGEEDVEAAGRTFHAEWFDTKGQTEAGPSNVRAWYADDCPGLLVKSVTRVPAARKLTTTTVVEYKTP
ncbi:hypothetical protein [Planctomyces sp. SH-PL62]|uniref:hypothetical protein n=1 Tax=Planctomyces sp. SH-PL62 TaxID=1636152 RepID=UPI00078EA021|nr:hypothetical protein [Planctomyces sp. SH-PL62]AMV37672.1 hypothetical protein VT85_09565 [Planctomyces sp. SH-PL62]